MDEDFQIINLKSKFLRISFKGVFGDHVGLPSFPTKCLQFKYKTTVLTAMVSLGNDKNQKLSYKCTSCLWKNMHYLLLQMKS